MSDEPQKPDQDQAGFFRRLGFTREDDLLKICPFCLAEIFYPMNHPPEKCDVCHSIFPSGKT